MKKEFSLLWDIASGKITEHGEYDIFYKRIKFFLRTLFTWNLSIRLLRFVTQHNNLYLNFRRNPSILTKIHRPYLYLSLKNQEKVNTIISSYECIDKNISDIVLQELYTNGCITLAELSGKQEKTIRVLLCLYSNFTKEGEMAIKVIDKNDTPLATLTFSFTRTSTGTQQVIIGGLQGPRRNVDTSCIKESTKVLHGLFPKKIAIYALLYLIEQFEGECQILAVSNEQHIYSSWRYKRALMSDYNQFWHELNGEPSDNGLWVLPSMIQRKPLEEVASKKRAEYQRRYQLLDHLRTEISTRVVS